MKLQPLVCVTVWKRINTIDRWLRAWNNCDKHGGKIVVFHNIHSDLGCFPKVKQIQTILKHNPDFYIPRLNVGADIGAMYELLKRKNEFPYWNVLGCFADDILPMRKDFLTIFLDKFSDPDVGMVAAFHEKKTDHFPEHIRTCAFMIRRQVAFNLKFHNFITSSNYSQSLQACHRFEHGGGGTGWPDEKNIFTQVREMNYKIELCYGDFETPWCMDQSVLWDTGHCFNHQLWDEFEKQFK